MSDDGIINLTAHVMVTVGPHMSDDGIIKLTAHCMVTVWLIV
jgi:hypothetical protein